MKCAERWIAAGMAAALMANGGSALADWVEDFEPGTTYAGSGTLVADPDNPANQVLQLAGGQWTSFTTEAAVGTITMRIYDFGEIPTFNGPRWGVADVDQSAAATIIQKNFLPANAGYGHSIETSRTGDWWSPAWYRGPRQVDVLDDPTTTTVFEGDGKWTTWTFDVAANGAVTLAWSADGYTKNIGTVDAMNQIWVSGGRSGQVANGVLVDNITYTIPEPAAFGMLGVAALVLRALRRRQSNR